MTINRHNLPICLCLCFFALAACQQGPHSTPFAMTVVPTRPPEVAVQRVTAVPTADMSTLTPTPTPTPTITNTPTATRTATSPPTLTPSPTFTPSETLVIGTLPTDDAVATEGPPTWTPPPDNPSVWVEDHYHLYRPISESGVNWADRTYPYGGTSGGRLQVHHGIDLANPLGTPVLAAADGTVAYAGNDLSTQFGPQTNYYGNLVVIQHNFMAPDGQPVFTLYGHLDRVEVETGQTVARGREIGKVGGTGVAFGAHLHFEVRVGNMYDFGATRNPELWIFPFARFGTLAGRVTDASGTVLREATLQVRSTDIQRYAFTYADASVNGDPAFNENFVLGDLPANYYEVSVTDNGRIRFRQTIYVYPNRTTWIEVQLKP